MSIPSAKATSDNNSNTLALPQRTEPNRLTSVIVASIVVCAISVSFALFSRGSIASLFRTAPSIVSATVVSSPLNTAATSVATPVMTDSKFSDRTPVYFFSHGGPTFMYSDKDQENGGDLGAFNTLRRIGKEITEKVKPKAVVVFSAHWQSSRDTIEVNTAEKTDLIYDFYGFPSFMYEEKFPNVGSIHVASKVIERLQAAGIKAKGVKRGLDHGVWVPFKVAFPDSNALKVPVVQVSLFKTEDPNQHIALGKALASLRLVFDLFQCASL